MLIFAHLCKSLMALVDKIFFIKPTHAIIANTMHGISYFKGTEYVDVYGDDAF